MTCEVCGADDHVTCFDNRNTDALVIELLEIEREIGARWGK